MTTVWQRVPSRARRRLIREDENAYASRLHVRHPGVSSGAVEIAEMLFLLIGTLVATLVVYGLSPGSDGRNRQRFNSRRHWPHALLGDVCKQRLASAVLLRPNSRHVRTVPLGFPPVVFFPFGDGDSRRR